MKRITLINLPSPFLYEPAMNPPIGLCSIATVCKNAGHDVEVVDFATIEGDYGSPLGVQWLSRIAEGADVVGISCVSAQHKWLRRVIEHIRGFEKVPLIVVGGPHASSCPTSVLQAGADIAFNGEGDFAFLRIVESDNPYTVLGVQHNFGGFTQYSLREFVEDLNTLPLPDFSLFDMDKYKRRLGGERAFHIMTARGCPYNCYFCDSSAIGGKVRHIAVEKVLELIDSVIESYGVKSFVLYDDTFTISSKRVQRFCEEFKKREVTWRCWSRANSLREEDLIAMKDSGIESIAIGIESGDPTVLHNINKRTTVEHNREALRLCKKVGVPVRCSLMFGNPGETRESLQNTINLMAETQPDEWNVSILMPTPGSEFWDNMDDHGLWFDKQKIIDSDYEELNRSGGSAVGFINVQIESMPPEEMKQNFYWFIKELERVCPRKKIRDTIQNINVEAL